MRKLQRLWGALVGLLGGASRSRSALETRSAQQPRETIVSPLNWREYPDGPVVRRGVNIDAADDSRAALGILAAAAQTTWPPSSTITVPTPRIVEES